MSYHMLVPDDLKKLIEDENEAQKAPGQFGSCAVERERWTNKLRNGQRVEALCELFLIGLTHAIRGANPKVWGSIAKISPVCLVPLSVLQLPEHEQAKRAYFIGRTVTENRPNVPTLSRLAEAVDDLIFSSSLQPVNQANIN